MRVTVGAIAVLGFAVTVAVAQPPARERGAELKAPQALPSGDLPPVVRGAGDDFPTAPYLSTTPVPRTYGAATGSNGSGWNVFPAGGTVPAPGPVGSLAPAQTDPNPPPKMIDRIKGYVTADKQPAPKAAPTPAEQATAHTPFRGTGTNGAPVYAGPPAYRWYGWGSVTPGANPLAPAGQYPKASANWYAITGATPGAFPVPITGPARVLPGTEPPNFGLSRSQPASQPVVPAAVPAQSQPQLVPRPSDYPDTSRNGWSTGSKFMPAPPAAEGPTHQTVSAPAAVAAPSLLPASPGPAFVPPPAPVGVPTITPAPVARPVAPVLPPPDMPVPVVSAPPLPSVSPATDSVTAAPTRLPENTPAVPAVGPRTDSVAALVPPAPPMPVSVPAPVVEPVKPIAPPAPVEPAKTPLPSVPPKPVPVAPAQLPSSVTEQPPHEEPTWQRNTEPTPPAPGTWTPAPGANPLPTTEPPGQMGQLGGTKGPVVARGQLNDSAPDPVTELIKKVCQGRAEGVEVRWTGAKKLSVCFEIRTAAAAQKLVADISRRPELTAYQIDFCVLVK
jgi:hypothetical protein